MAGEDDFGARLSLAMKLLNLSNGALASEARADKSLTSRWARGLATPRGPYRAVLTDIVRARVPGFTQLSWDLPLDQFARLVAGDAVPPLPESAIEPQTAPAAVLVESVTVAAVPAPIPSGPRWQSRRVAAIAIALLLVVAIGIGVYRWTRPAPVPLAVVPPLASIAVLPFDNMSGDPAKAYFSDGFSEELLNELANVAGLRVASRTDSFALKDKGLDIAQIARRLHVATVLEGSVRENGKRVRITAQLINASTGFHVWSQEYDRDLTDILKVQDEIGGAIATALSRRLLPGTRPAVAIDPQVYRLYLQGLAIFHVGTRANALRAVAIMSQVTARAPDFADGFASLGMAYQAAADYDHATDLDTLGAAAFARALQLDPGNRRALGAYPYLLFKQWRWTDGIAATRRAAAAHDDAGDRALAIMYFMFDLPEGTAAAQRRLVANQPNNWWQHGFLSEALFKLGRYREAQNAARAAYALEPGVYSLENWCVASAMLGDIAGARRLEAQLRAKSPGPKLSSALAGCTKYIAVRTNDLGALKTLADTAARRFAPGDELSATLIGGYYLQGGDLDHALAWYERAFAERNYAVFQDMALRADQSTPVARRLMTDPRWRALWQRPAVQIWLKARAGLAGSPIPGG